MIPTLEGDILLTGVDEDEASENEDGLADVSL